MISLGTTCLLRYTTSSMMIDHERTPSVNLADLDVLYYLACLHEYYDRLYHFQRLYNYSNRNCLHGSLTELRNHTCHFHTDRKSVLHMPPLGLDKIITTQEVSLFGVYQFKDVTFILKRQIICGCIVALQKMKLVLSFALRKRVFQKRKQSG